MTNLGNVSGMKHKMTAKEKPMITLIKKIHFRPMFSLSAIHSPTGDPIDGPMFAPTCKSLASLTSGAGGEEISDLTHDEKGHGLSRTIDIPKKIRNCTSYI